MDLRNALICDIWGSFQKGDRVMRRKLVGLAVLAACAAGLWQASPAFSQETQPFYLKDRGPGIPTSMFGTYIQKGEWIVYPFFEYYLDNNLEYSPNEFGFSARPGFPRKVPGQRRPRVPRLRDLTDRLAFEVEAAMIRASLEKSPDDPIGHARQADRIRASATCRSSSTGCGPRRLERRPGFFSYAEVVFPHHKTKYLIGTPELETKAGIGHHQGLPVGHDHREGGRRAGRRRLRPRRDRRRVLQAAVAGFCVYAGFEGTQDEIEFIAEIQWWLSDTVRFKINNGFGVTSKATDWAPEIGLMISIR